MEIATAQQAHQSLMAFSSEQLAVLRPARSIRELSDQQEHYAAAEMLVKFGAEVSNLHHSFSDYLTHARQQSPRAMIT